MTEILRESHSHINAHTSNVPYEILRESHSRINAHTSNASQLGIFHANFHVNMFLVKLPNTSTRGFLSM